MHGAVGWPGLSSSMAAEGRGGHGRPLPGLRVGMGWAPGVGGRGEDLLAHLPGVCAAAAKLGDVPLSGCMHGCCSAASWDACRFVAAPHPRHWPELTGCQPWALRAEPGCLVTARRPRGHEGPREGSVPISPCSPRPQAASRDSHCLHGALGPGCVPMFVMAVVPSPAGR